jgi:hypothetical protein
VKGGHLLFQSHPLNTIGGPAEVIAISMATPLNVGETALLSCVGTGDPDVEISWSFNRVTLANTSLVATYERDTIRGGQVFKQSFLQVCGVTEADAGDYTCIVRNGLTSVFATTQITGGWGLDSSILFLSLSV